MGDLQAGNYFIVPAYVTSKCIGIGDGGKGNSGGLGNGATLHLHDRGRWLDSEVFNVSYPEGRGAQILSLFSGRALDVGGIAKSGQVVNMYTDLNDAGQRWDIARTGSTVAVDGTALETMWVSPTANSGVRLDVYAQGTQTGNKVWIYAKNDTLAQQFAFVPVPQMRDGGVYELFPAYSTGMRLDTDNGNRGSNVNCHSTSTSNGQKWLLTKEGDYWRFRNVGAGMYMDVQPNKTLANGTNVCTWPDDSSNGQRWKVDRQGSHPYRGVSCALVTIGAAKSSTYLLDAYNPINTNKCNVDVRTATSGGTQMWGLYPTIATDSHIPAPAGMSITATLGRLGTTPLPMTNQSFYAHWICTDAWLVGANHYQWRWRRRYLKTWSSTWTAWTEWTAWHTPGIRNADGWTWETEPMDGSYDPDQYKNLEFEWQVRCVGVDEESMVVGPAADATAYVAFRPTFSWNWDKFGLSPHGIRFDYTTDYPAGMSHLYITKVWKAGRNILSKEVSAKTLDSSSSVLIPSDHLTEQVTDGDKLSFEYSVGNDQVDRWYSNVLSTKEFTVHYDNGHNLDVTPTLAAGRLRTLSATVPHVGTERMWVDCQTFGRRELKGTVSGDKTTFAVSFPFGRDFDLYTECVSSDGDTWGTDYTHVSRYDDVMQKLSPAHVWTWDGGGCILEANKEPLVTDRTLEADCTSVSLVGRAHETVYFNTVVKGKFKASGMLYDGVTESVPDDFVKLQGKRHVHYRAPSGEEAEVAVTSVSYVTHREFTTVEVNMTEETI